MLTLTYCTVEGLALPSFLNGSAGTNRGAAPKIAAANDIEAIQTWQHRYDRTSTSFQSYKKESERLLLWAVNNRQKPMSSLTYDDMAEYAKFLSDPRPAELWISEKGSKVSRTHPDWRPFVGPLSPMSKRHAFRILNSMMKWLTDAGYLHINPLALSRIEPRKGKPFVTRLLQRDLWSEILAFVECMPRTTARDNAKYARARWVISLFYLSGLRISEAISAEMGNFFERYAGGQTSQWWIEIHGKGDKTRLVPATVELMEELIRYRKSHGLSELPVEGERTPLVGALHDVRSPINRASLHVFLKQIFAGAALRLSAREGGDARATRLAQASAHWLRHTAGSAMADNHVDVRHIRDNLGHASLTTTNLYLHVDDDERHSDISAKHRIGWAEVETKDIASAEPAKGLNDDAGTAEPFRPQPNS